MQAPLLRNCPQALVRDDDLQQASSRRRNPYARVRSQHANEFDFGAKSEVPKIRGCRVQAMKTRVGE